MVIPIVVGTVPKNYKKNQIRNQRKSGDKSNLQYCWDQPRDLRTLAATRPTAYSGMKISPAIK